MHKNLEGNKKKKKIQSSKNIVTFPCFPSFIGFSEQQGTLFSGCLKCAQQALAYQQILTFIDPTATLQPSTFSAILAACPHNNHNNNNNNHSDCSNNNNNNNNNNSNNSNGNHN